MNTPATQKQRDFILSQALEAYTRAGKTPEINTPDEALTAYGITAEELTPETAATVIEWFQGEKEGSFFWYLVSENIRAKISQRRSAGLELTLIQRGEAIVDEISKRLRSKRISTKYVTGIINGEYEGVQKRFLDQIFAEAGTSYEEIVADLPLED